MFSSVLPLTYRLYFFAILKKFVASTWIVIWKSIGRYGVHSYCCRPFQNQLHHHMVSQQLQIITIYHFLLINKFNSTLANWWGSNFAAGTFQRLFWTNCVAVALTILRVTQWRKEGTAWWSSFQQWRRRCTFFQDHTCAMFVIIWVHRHKRFYAKHQRITEDSPPRLLF